MVTIWDNGSTDGSSEICADFARNDSRFRHVRSQTTVPPLENFKKGLRLASADYFMWRADDDLTDNGFLAATVKALDAKPDARLAVANVRRTNTTTGRTADYQVPVALKGDHASRAAASLRACHPSWFYGLWRREALLADLAVLDAYPFLWAADHLATMRAMLNDQVAFAPESTFTQRIMKEGDYHLSSVERLRARKSYVAISKRLLDEGDYSLSDKAILRKAIEQHANRRVAPWFRTYKRALRERLRSLLPS